MTGTPPTLRAASAGSTLRQPRTQPARLRIAPQGRDQPLGALVGAHHEGDVRPALSAAPAEPRQHERALDPEADGADAGKEQEKAAVDFALLGEEQRRR